MKAWNHKWQFLNLKFFWQQATTFQSMDGTMSGVCVCKCVCGQTLVWTVSSSYLTHHSLLLSPSILHVFTSLWPLFMKPHLFFSRGLTPSALHPSLSLYSSERHSFNLNFNLLQHTAEWGSSKWTWLEVSPTWVLGAQRLNDLSSV